MPKSQANFQANSKLTWKLAWRLAWRLGVGSALGFGAWSLGFDVEPVALAQQRPAFRTTRELVSVDVVVRDKNGNVVRGLTQADFELREDGQPQQLDTFTFQEISDR